ncbi:MAG TPA: hypothetical protein VGK54_18625 [Chloroflexota bacterium]|jgi:hypothetical protein
MRIPQPELWVIDWVLCSQGESVNGQKLEALMSWRDLRERIWRAQMSAELATEDPAKPAEAEIELSPEEYELLLAIVPTTFRWGTGEDCGFSLKRRIAQELWGAEETEKHSLTMSIAAMFGKEDRDASGSHNGTDENAGADPATHAA